MAAEKRCGGRSPLWVMGVEPAGGVRQPQRVVLNIKLAPRCDIDTANDNLLQLPGTCNDRTEAINGRLEHLRGSALGLRNLTDYIARSLLETGGFRPRLHRHSR